MFWRSYGHYTVSNSRKAGTHPSGTNFTIHRCPARAYLYCINTIYKYRVRLPKRSGQLPPETHMAGALI